ncbi:MAG: DUF4292 domain-containing protein [Chitinophagaceae bacterium]|nr:DUF4292 domain-containing protein [Chitinophagaceae bacterium]
MPVKTIGAILILSVTIYSCRSSKKLQSAITKKDTTITLLVNPAESDSAKLVHTAFEKIRSNRIEFTTFSSKIKVDYNDSKQRNYDFNAFVRIQKDSVIWISIIAALGIEAFRVYITPDSVKIRNSLDKEVQLQSVNYIKELIKLPVDFFTLQDIIVGNPVFLDSTNVLMYKETEGFISLSTSDSAFKQLLTMKKENFAIFHSKLDDVDATRNRTADFTYNDYTTIDGRLFSEERKIAVAEKTRLEISLNIKQPEFDKPLNFPFTIPKNYKVK